MKMRFRLLHLLILMTVICISIPSYIAYKRSQHKRHFYRYAELMDKLRTGKYSALYPLRFGEATSAADVKRAQELNSISDEMAQLREDLTKEELRELLTWEHFKAMEEPNANRQ